MLHSMANVMATATARLARVVTFWASHLMIMFMHMHMHVHMHMHGAEFEFKIIAIKLIRTSDVRKLSCERARAVREWRWDIAAVLAPAAVVLRSKPGVACVRPPTEFAMKSAGCCW